MKLQAATYSSPYPTQGKFENVFIEDISYKINRTENLLVVKFQMYHEVDSKKIVLEESQLSFKGTNVEMEQGLPTSNKTAILKVFTPNFDTGVPDVEEVPLLQYLYTHEGQMPEQYEIVEWGYPTYENVLQYFSGGDLTAPELFVNDPFAREWLKNSLQMKGQFVGEQFDFV